MRVITEEPLYNYIARFPDTKTSLQAWLKTVKKAQWSNFADVKKGLKKILILILALAAASCAFAQEAPGGFDPKQHSTFSTDRPDGRYLSSRAVAHRLMLSRPPRLQYHSGMDPGQFGQWQSDVASTMARLMSHPDTVDIPAARKVGEWQRDGYTLQKWESYPFSEAVVPFLMLVPDSVKAGRPAPGILCIPGYGQTKELLAGETAIGLDTSSVSQTKAAMARLYAKEGYVAVAVDNPAFGETDDLERLAGRGVGDYVTFARVLLELDWNYLGYTSYVDKVVLDWMKTNPDIRRDRLVVSGFSLGTEPLMAIGVMDPEIYAFVYNDFLCTTRERALVMTLPDAKGSRPWPNDIAHLIPGFLTEFDFPDLVAALAPRPVICTEGGMDRDFRSVADAFATAGAPGAFQAHHYAKYADASDRVPLDTMPEGIDRATFFRLANVDPPSHYFKAEHVLPWLRDVLK